MASAQLHEALGCLRPKDFTTDVPLDDLQTWMRDILTNGETIVNSIPQVPGGTDFLSSERKRTDVNGAHNASEMTVSDARSPPFDPSFEPLQALWGKPTNASKNPQKISVYKMAGADRYGSWFARRSVHEGLGFTKWKRALQQEFAESLAVEGGPGVGSIRGIGGDKRLERKVVEGLGKLEDTSKFLDWACAKEDLPDPEAVEQEGLPSAADKEAAQVEDEAQPRASFSAASRNAQLAGVGTSIADLPLTEPATIKNGSDSVSDTESLNSFASAEQWATANGGPDGEDEHAPPLPPRRVSGESVGSDLTKSQSAQNRYDREMQKLDSKRTALEEKMRKLKEKEQAREQQATEREEREKRRAGEKYQREMEKLAAKRDKEAQRREQRRKKEEEKNIVTRVQRERDEFKSRAEMAEHENKLLKEQLGELQHQNTKLVQSLGKSEQGKQVLKSINDELSRARSSSATSSVKSKGSKRSGDEKVTG
ncbi:putative reticulocyte-binding protein 2 [Diplodia seriata]|uniref:Putative reticulocyte-binding protein 2 n=1 Tax=Diplodia seriata TaxID=420778 RepID=A0A0G2F071_9PEZI|nr:putative reticulocyte-binding protein 2 [Diplodia seriata]